MKQSFIPRYNIDMKYKDVRKSIRKIIVIDTSENILIKSLADFLGTSESEAIRQAIKRYAFELGINNNNNNNQGEK
jgi:predicted nucleic acid-binding protein